MTDCIFRVVVDAWPTPDGRPFTNQDDQVWDEVGQPDAPAWLPASDVMERWIRRDEDNYNCYIAPQVDTRRCLARSTAHRRLKQARALGVTAHIETAEIGEWETLQ